MTELAWVQSFAATLSLPQLGPGELQSAAFEHYDAVTKGAKAQDIVNVLEGSAREEWIQRRELDFLRAGIAAGTPELVRLMQKTSEPAVKSAIIETIYNAAAKTYPSLAPLAAKVCAQKKEQLGARSSSPIGKGVEVNLEIEEEPTKSETPSAESREDTVEDELRRLVNVQFLSICLLTESLIPACEKRGITLSPELQSTLLTNLLNQAYRSGVHKRVPLALK
jgi:hypothetical protein